MAQAASKLDAVLGVRAPAGRGLVAVGCANGQVSLLDPRAGYKVEQIMEAHTGGLVAMDASGGLLATSGLGTRQGQLVTDLNVKVPCNFWCSIPTAACMTALCACYQQARQD